MQLTRRMFMGSALGTAAAMGLAACGANGGGAGAGAAADKALTGTYAIHVGGYDWGPGVDKAIVTFDAPLDAVSASDFTVTETKQVTDWADPTFPVIETTLDRQVTDAYLADVDGNKTEEPSNTIALELYVSPLDGGNMVFNMDSQFATWCDPYFLTFTLAEGASLTSDGAAVTGVTVEQNPAAQTTAADVFKQGAYTASDGIAFDYVAYTPEEESDALLVWLHGMGEGGGQVTGKTTPYAPVLGGRVTALASEALQGKMPIHVLVPQCPTVWSDIDGQMTNFQGGIDLRDDCYYREALAELIDSYAEGIGATKVVIAGCSAGGYMTMNLAAHYQDKYTAYVPVCEAYKDRFITPEDALLAADAKSLLVVVDTHRPNSLEYPGLSEKFDTVCVVDHHRRTANYIKDAELFYSEPNSSSACEMVTELIEYFPEDIQPDPMTCNALLAGIMLDTRNFVLGTGVRTFEAAAYLKNHGADTVAVKQLFSNSLDNYKVKASILSSAETYHDCAIASTDQVVPNMRVIASQVADDMLSVTGVKSSYVLFESGGKINISARSLGQMNVQVIMEKLGGGGHFTMAATQIADISMEEAITLVKKSIDEYIEME